MSNASSLIVCTFAFGALAALFATPALADASAARDVPASGVPKALLASVYRHTTDHDGDKLQAGSETVLIFDRNGVAYLLETRSVWAREGRYSFRNGRLSLRFNSGGFVLEATLPFAPGARELTLPFKLLTRGKGTSHWERPEDWLLPNTLGAIFSAVTLTRKLESSKALEVALAYARSFIVPAPKKPVELPDFQAFETPRLLKVEHEGTDIILTLEDGFETHVLLR